MASLLIMNDIVLGRLRKGILDDLELYTGANDGSWISKYHEDIDPFFNSRDYDFIYPELRCEGSLADSEYQNIVAIYSAMKNLPPALAISENIWAALCYGKYWEYCASRWFNEKSSEGKIQERMMYASQSRRATLRNAISRLWWIGHITYDETRGNEFELTQWLCRDQNFLQNIIERNYSSNPYIVREFTSTLIAIEDEGLKMDKPRVAELSKYVNQLGGYYVLDCMPEGLLEKKVRNRADELWG